MREEIERRNTMTTAVLDYFMAHPFEWVNVHKLAHLGGFAAWRTRVSDARKVVKREGGDIIWNQQRQESCYRYHPHAPIGRDSGEHVPREWNTNGPFTREDQQDLEAALVAMNEPGVSIPWSKVKQQVLRFK